MITRSLKPTIIESIFMLRKNSGRPEKPKVWVEAYGCSASMADSEMISGLLKASGYEFASSQNEGALSIIVTCGVKDTTEHRMLSRIKSLSKSGKPLVVAGCLPKADTARIEAINPNASMIGPHSIDRVVDVTKSMFSGKKLVVLEDSATDKVNITR
ncbi:MAG TPA: hypothetical protein VLA68_04400, partial [Nitrososphaera sp.]|nr:hypothetical protein [Nitrososphaera sp.]